MVGYRHVRNVRRVICLIQRLYIRLHGAKVSVVDQRTPTLPRILHYSFQDASRALNAVRIKETRGQTDSRADTRACISLLRTSIAADDKSKFTETCGIA